jgi:hypothetical protein
LDDLGVVEHRARGHSKGHCQKRPKVHCLQKMTFL